MNGKIYRSITPQSFYVLRSSGGGQWIGQNDPLPDWIDENFLQFLIKSGQAVETAQQAAPSLT